MPVLLSRHEEVAVLTLDRPEALNALSAAILEEIDRNLDAVARTDARALLVTGAGSKAPSSARRCSAGWPICRCPRWR